MFGLMHNNRPKPVPRKHCYHPFWSEKGEKVVIEGTNIGQRVCCNCNQLKFYKGPEKGHGGYVPKQELVVLENKAECKGYEDNYSGAFDYEF